MSILQTDKKISDSHSSMFIFSRKQFGISQFWKNIFNGNATNLKTGPKAQVAPNVLNVGEMCLNWKFIFIQCLMKISVFVAIVG